MGFGILFIGYIFTVFDTGIMYIDSISSVFMQVLRFIGYGITCIGCFRLSRYIKKCSLAFSSALFLSILSALDTVFHCLTVYSSVSIPLPVRTVLFVLFAFVYAYFQFFLLKGLCDITEQTSLSKENKRSKALFNITMFFCLLNVVASTGILSPMADIRYVLYVIVTIANAYNIFTCYMWIGLPEPEEKEEQDGARVSEKEKKHDKKRKK
ncbi:MAG: hypothetical protein IKT65_03330 [Clostridia bacterium]|nr:hypothetical protein [Clostridia bacterium]